MKVAFITNWQDTCGIAIYGENLIKYFPEDVEFHVIPPSSMSYALEQAKGCDIVHINYHEGLSFYFSLPEFLNRTGLPAILTNHTTTFEGAWYDLLNKIVTHIPNTDFGDRNVVVPQPILNIEFEENGPEELVLCQAGFPFPWKNYPLICEAANEIYAQGYLTPRVLFFMPDTYHYDTYKEIAKCQEILQPGIPFTYVTEWLDDISLVERMHNEASVMVYYTGEKREGPSASVRLGIATKHPVVVNGNAYQYQDIKNESGIYPAYNEVELANVITKAFEENRWAENLIKNQNYATVGSLYYDIYKEVLSGIKTPVLNS